jgi:hypothetical protein
MDITALLTLSWLVWASNSNEAAFAVTVELGFLKLKPKDFVLMPAGGGSAGEPRQMLPV